MPGIGLAIYGGIKAALAVKGIAGFFIKLGFSVGISYGAKLLTRLLSPRRPPLEALGGPKHTIRGEVVNARWILGKVRTAGVLCYFGSRSREARMGLILSEGACEKIDGQMWIDGHAVRLTRTPHTDGDLLRPVSGSRYYGKIEVREYFRADGTQGLYLRTPAPTQIYTYDQGDGTYGPVPTPWTERQKMAGVPPERAPVVPFVTSYPEWTTDHKLNGLSWVYVRLTQPPYGQDIDKRFWTRVPNLDSG